MAIRSDVAGIEKAYLLDMLAVEGARILEIGCGDGRLTRQYADLARSVVGVDVTPQGLAEASSATTSYVTASGVNLPFRDCSFDQALFAWSF